MSEARAVTWRSGLAAALQVDPADLVPERLLFDDVEVDVPRLDVFAVELFVQDLRPGFAFQGLDHIRWVTVADLAYYCDVDLLGPNASDEGAL